MEIKKKHLSRTAPETQWDAYATFTGTGIKLNASVRDHLLPHRFCRVNIEKSGDVLLSPSDSQEDYRLTLCNGQMSLSKCLLVRHIGIAKSQRLRAPCLLLADGAVLIKISGAQMY